MARRAVLFACVLLVGAGLARPIFAQDSPPESCADCHSDPIKPTESGPPHALLQDSVHAALDCTDCHQSISLEETDATSDKPHGAAPEPVNCGECHEDETAVYVKHGRLEIGKDPDLPACWSCHGRHDIVATSDTRSRVHPINLPNTCQSCHVDVNMVKRHEFLREAPIRLYESSIHGKASIKGRYMAATCNDCHSAADPDGHRTAHRVLGAGDPESPISFFNIPNTCGECHEPIMNDYWDGIHGKLVRRGAVDAPVCTTCHGEHGIIEADDPRSPVSAARLAEATCSPCHESEVLNEKYGIPPGRLRSWVDSYHGLKSRAGKRGEVHVANCASCHGSHRILPHTDPTSSIYPDNLQDTCGKCHEKISVELATASIHESATGIKTGWPRFFTVFYLWMIGITIGLMVLHNLADWFRHVRNMRRETFVVRLTTSETLQHWALMVSFVVLVISGFSLRFSEAWWAKLIFGWGEGEWFVVRGTIHRVAAVIFVIYCLWHFMYLFGRRGRRWMREMILSKRDLVNIKENTLFFLGQRQTKPRFGRFTYMEKCEYWALIWGAVIMTATGVLLWFDDYFVEKWRLPKGFLDVILVIHYYEAWLATLAILVWHIYGTIFSPGVYPVNPAWLTGKMPKAMYDHEHPEGPRLKGHLYRFGYDEEEEPEASPPTSESD